MECNVCLQFWNSDDCIPKSLPCGHTFCANCLAAIFAKQKTGITCPTCVTNHKITQAELMALPKNYGLLALIRDKVSSTRKKPSLASGIEISAKSPPLAPEYGPAEMEREYIEKVVINHPQCDKHKMLIHSYVPGSKQLLCDKCIQELPKSVTQINPILKVCRDLRQQIAKAKNTLLIKKSEINRYKSVMQYLADFNKKETENSISEHYQKLNELICESEKKTREKFKIACELQQNTITGYTVFFIKVINNKN